MTPRIPGLGGRPSLSKNTSHVTFNFEKSSTQLFPELQRPVATVALWSETSKSWKKVTMLIDTGADYTIIPRYVAIWAEIDTSQAKTYDTVGVGGTQKVHFIEKLKVKLGPFERTIPVGIIDSTKVPPLMGRQAFFNDFEVLFKDKQVTFLVN